MSFNSEHPDADRLMAMYSELSDLQSEIWESMHGVDLSYLNDQIDQLQAEIDDLELDVFSL